MISDCILLMGVQALRVFKTEVNFKDRRKGFFCFVFSFFFCDAGALIQGLHLETLHQPFFNTGFFEIGSHKLLARAGFEPRP
jgi:hypothetical protein